MTTGEILGLALQVLGTLIAGYALTGEWRDRQPKVKPPKRPRVQNPWDGKWRTKTPKIWDSDRRQYQERMRRPGVSPRMAGSDPDLIGLAEWVAGILGETRTNLREDWKRQERGSAELHQATVALFDSLQEAHRATRRRVLIEMTGLAIVMVGTVVSSVAS